MHITRTITLLLLLSFGISSAHAQSKYASTTTRAMDSTEYLRKKVAPDFWSMIFHYVPQGENMCQTASLVAVFNAMKNADKIDSETKNITQAALVEKVNDPEWKEAMRTKKCFSLDRFAKLVDRALKLYFGERYSVRVVHVDSLDEKAIAGYLNDFAQNEKSANDFIIANFDQAVFTGEAEPAGHISPVAAYDATAKRILVLDVDREWYTPYWVPVSEFFKGLNMPDKKAEKSRGYLVIAPKDAH